MRWRRNPQGPVRTARFRAGRPAGDAGFALAEMVVAGTAMLCLALPAYAMLRRTLDVADLMATRFAQNAQARQVARLLADGSSASQGLLNLNPRGWTFVEGLHSRRAAVATDWPSGSALRSNYRFFLLDGLLLGLQGDAVAQVVVPCLGVGIPLPDCTGTESKGVQGWLGADPVVTATGPGSTVAAVTVSLTSPYRAVRAKTAAAAGTEQYRMQFNLNVE